MVYIAGVQNLNNRVYNSPNFGKAKTENIVGEEENDTLLVQEKKKHPVTTAIKIQGDKLTKAFTKYPKKGFEGSKNADFYEFLAMGTVPYLTGSATMIAVFNLVGKSAIGKKMGLGVIFYGLAKTLSKKLIETPVNMKYGIDVNLPYKKVINELPEENNKDNLKSYQYRKAYESVDFPRWDLFYGNKNYGPNRNSYYESVGKKMGLSDDQLKHADQKVKPLIKEKVIKTKLFSNLSSYLWAATGVGIAMQKPWDTLVLNPLTRITNYKNYKNIAKEAAKSGIKVGKYNNIFKEFGSKFVESCKSFVNNNGKGTKIAGRALLGAAVGMTLLGNFSTLFDFNNKGAHAQASTSLIDESKEKVVC